MLLEEIESIVQSALSTEFRLAEMPITFYSKNGLDWIKISILYIDGDVKIGYTYHGFLNDGGQFKSRDCFSKRHLEISNRITDALNKHEIGKKIVD